jgi:hypothetical protein
MEMPQMKPVDKFAYELIEQSVEYSVSYEALLQEEEVDLNILVRKMLVAAEKRLLQISDFCTIKVADFRKDYSNITQLEINNGRLYVVMSFIKEIRIYDLRNKDCTQVATLNIRSFPGQYFNPREIFFDMTYSHYRQPILFVRQWNELLSIRLQGTDYQPSIVSISTLPQSKNGTVVIALPYLAYLNFLDSTIQVFRLDEARRLAYQR